MPEIRFDAVQLSRTGAFKSQIHGGRPHGRTAFPRPNLIAPEIAWGPGPALRSEARRGVVGPGSSLSYDSQAGSGVFPAPPTLSRRRVRRHRHHSTCRGRSCRTHRRLPGHERCWLLRYRRRSRRYRCCCPSARTIIRSDATVSASVRHRSATRDSGGNLLPTEDDRGPCRGNVVAHRLSKRQLKWPASIKAYPGRGVDAGS